MHINKQQKGFTLLEVMIVLLVSSIVMVGIMALFFNMIKHSRTTVDAGRLDQALHAAMTSMVTDIRRAGYWANAQTSSTNPLMVSGDTDIEVDASGHCILLAYDHDSDGVLPDVGGDTDDERYGYRLINNRIQYRPAGAVHDCATSSKNWADLIDSSVIKITALSFVKNEHIIDLDKSGPGTAALSLRSITITLAGELVEDPAAQKTLTQMVKVYNDKYTP